MNVSEIRLFKDPDKSFIVYHERDQFSPWHHHPEYELVLITKGKGKRMVGDHIDRFEENDLVFLGSQTPHEWLCDKTYFAGENGFSGEGIVVQFTYDFLGDKFFEISENFALKNFLLRSAPGFEITGDTKARIIPIVKEMIDMNGTDQLYALFKIFNLLQSSDDLTPLSSHAFIETYSVQDNHSIQKALQFILQNFQKPIQMKDLLTLTNMSNTTFYTLFKRSYRMTYKNYLMNIRIGYACKLLLDSEKNIAEIAYDSGFENLSNFNRHFKKIKGVTPHHYQKENKRLPLHEQGFAG